MPAITFNTEIGNVKSEINSGLAASQYTAKDLVYVSKAIEALSAAAANSGNFDTAYINSLLYVGSAAEAFNSGASLTNPIAVFQADANNYAQIAFKNINTGSSASTDIIMYTNNGDDNSGWIDMGITSSTYSDPAFTITGAGDGYIFMSGSGNGSTDRGNLVLATDSTGTQNKIIFAAGGLASDNTQMSITPDQNVHIEIPTPSTSPSTGALTVVGGVGITGDINIAGSLTFGGASSSLQTSTLSVSDPLIFVGSNNATDAVDLGLIAEYATTTSTITKAISNKALTSNVATLTTSTTHGFSVGDIVVVGSVDSTFNGTYVVKAVPTTTTFTYDKTASNVTSAAVSPAGTAEVTTKRRFAGVVRDASDGVVKFFKDATTKPSSVINFAEVGVSYASIVVGGATIGSVTNTEIGYLSGVSSAIQTQINTKSPSASPTFTGNVTLPNTTTIGSITSTEIGYLSGVSSNLQTQLDAKLSSATASSTYAALTGATFTGNVQLEEVSEKTVDITLASNVGTLDWTAGNIFYIATAPTAAMTFNVTNVPTTVSKIMTINIFVTQGATGYIPTTFQIGGVGQTIRWPGGIAPSATSSAGKIDIFAFTMQRTSGGSWIVYGTSSLNF